MKLQRVQYIPKELEAGVLYVSEEFGAVAHVCACGCGAKIRTPLGPTEWLFEETPKGPSLYPSIGNWQQKCQSHYWIREGVIVWSTQWTPEQIEAGRRHEEKRRKAYYTQLGQKSILAQIWEWIIVLFK